MCFTKIVTSGWLCPNPIFADVLNDVIEPQRLSKFFYQNQFPFLIMQNPTYTLLNIFNEDKSSKRLI